MKQESALAWAERRLAGLGAAPGDDDETRARKAALTIAAASITGLAVIWVGTYAILGMPQAAVIPLVYQVASIGSLTERAEWSRTACQT